MSRVFSNRRRPGLRRRPRVVEVLESRRMLDASYHSLAAGALVQDWSNISQISRDNDWSGVPSIVGYLGDGLTLADGADPQTVTSGTLGTSAVLANLSDPSSGTGAGPAEFELADPTVALRGGGSESTPTSPAPSLLLFLDTTGTTGTHVSFDLRDIDGSGRNALEPFAVQYRIGSTGVFTNLPSAFVGDATQGPNLASLVTHVGVILPSNVDGHSQVQVRIVTTHAASADEWVGVDNINAWASTGPNAPPTISVPTGTQTIAFHSPIVFHTTPTAFVVSDPDAGADPVQVQLSATHGVMTLSSTKGLNVTAGTGTNDASMTFSGTIAALNFALDGLTFAPDPSYHGDASISVSVNDLGHNGSGGVGIDSGLVSLNILNEAPAVHNDIPVGTEDTPLVIDVLANDADPENDPLSVVNLTNPSHGTIQLNADGTITYTPDSNFNGPDSFQYSASDGSLVSSPATVFITVQPVDDPPVATEDSATTDEDVPVRIFVLSNDTDIDSPTLTPVDVTKPAHGSVVVNSDGSLTYTPDLNFNGSDSFQYSASDGTLSSQPTTVMVFVNPVNDPPIAQNAAVSVDENGSINIDLFQYISDVDSTDLFLRLRGGPDHGAFIPNANKTFNYTPNFHYNGIDTISFQASDGYSLSNMATLTIIVNPINDPPKIVVPVTNFQVQEGTNLHFTISSTDIDGPTDTPHYSLGPNAPGGMTINEATGEVSWTPGDGPQTVSVIVTVTDSGIPAFSDSGIVNIQVTNVAPTVAPISGASLYQGGRFQFAGSFSDPGTETWSALVDYGDGSGTKPQALNPNKTFALNHVYNAVGTYVGYVVVTDKDGASNHSTFTVNVAPALVTMTVATSTSKTGLGVFTLSFSSAIDASTATKTSHYTLVQAGRDKKFGTKDDIKIAIGSAAYDKAKSRITITTKKRFTLSTTPVRLTVTGLNDTMGRGIDASRSGVPGSDYVGLFAKTVKKPTKSKK